jgi:RNA polymerase sigma-70 factor (ECF subfamily)
MAAFILQKTEGMTQAQIAQVMGLSEKAVESLLSRAKENLRKILNRYYHG